MPLPLFDRPLFLINKFTDFGTQLAIYLNSNEQMNSLDSQGIAKTVRAHPIDRNNSDFQFVFTQGRSEGTFWIKHVNTQRVISTYPGVIGGYPYFSTNLGVFCTGLVENKYANDYAYDWFIDHPNEDMLCHKGADPVNYGDVHRFLEVTPFPTQQDNVPDGTPYVNTYVWSEGGSSNQRWDWEYVAPTKIIHPFHMNR